jgi:hypothetical protein
MAFGFKDKPQVSSHSATKSSDINDPKWDLGDTILKTLHPKVANTLDNTIQPYDMAEDLIKYFNGDIEKATQKAIEINKAFHEKHGERVDVGLHWDHWTESLPELYGLKG